MEWIIWMSIALMVGMMVYVVYRDVYRRFIRPFLCYKFVVFDIDDEYTFIERKKNAKVREGLKGFELFKRKNKETGKEEGEFYTLPLEQGFGGIDESFSKRDDLGMVTYYYYRNNNTPIRIVPDQEIKMVLNDARATSKILKTNIFDSSISMEETNEGKINRRLIIIIGAVVLLIIIFKDKIAGLLG
jgi:hypothetical protein